MKITKKQLRRIIKEAVGYYSDEDMPQAWHSGYDDALDGYDPMSTDPDYEAGHEAGVIDSQKSKTRNVEQGYQ